MRACRAELALRLAAADVLAHAAGMSASPSARSSFQTPRASLGVHGQPHAPLGVSYVQGAHLLGALGSSGDQPSSNARRSTSSAGTPARHTAGSGASDRSPERLPSISVGLHASAGGQGGSHRLARLSGSTPQLGLGLALPPPPAPSAPLPQLLPHGPAAAVGGGACVEHGLTTAPGTPAAPPAGTPSRGTTAAPSAAATAAVAPAWYLPPEPCGARVRASFDSPGASGPSHAQAHVPGVNPSFSAGVLHTQASEAGQPSDLYVLFASRPGHPFAGSWDDDGREETDTFLSSFGELGLGLTGSRFAPPSVRGARAWRPNAPLVGSVAGREPTTGGGGAATVAAVAPVAGSRARLPSTRATQPPLSSPAAAGIYVPGGQPRGGQGGRGSCGSVALSAAEGTAGRLVSAQEASRGAPLDRTRGARASGAAC